MRELSENVLVWCLNVQSKYTVRGEVSGSYSEQHKSQQVQNGNKMHYNAFYMNLGQSRPKSTIGQLWSTLEVKQAYTSLIKTKQV